MKLTAKAILLLVTLFLVNLGAADTAKFTLKGAVVTPDGTMVPEFTVVVRPIVDKPELVLRKRFKNGVFAVEGLRRDKYQVQVTAPRFIGMKMDVNFPKNRSTRQYRVVVLHRMRNELRHPTDASLYTVSAKAMLQKVPDKATRSYEQGVALHIEGKLEEALSAYGDAIRAYPEYMQALLDIGAVYITMNRPDSALTFLRRAHRIDGSNTIVRLNMAIALMTKRGYAEATDLLQKVYKDESRKSLALFYLSRIQFYQKNYQEAERLLREALNEDPEMLDGWVMLVNIALEQENYASAREGLTRLREAMNNGLFTKFVEDQLAVMGGN